MHIGEYLKKKREEKGYTQEKLAELAHVSDRTIRRIEKDSYPKSNKAFKRICDILNIPLSDDKNIKELKFNKDVDYLEPSEMLSKLELENSQALYFEIDNKLMSAYRLSQEGNFKEALDKLFRLYLEDYIDINKELGHGNILVDIGYKKTQIIKYEYYIDYIIVSIEGKSYKVNLIKNKGDIFIGAVQLSDDTGTMLYPALGKLFRDKEEFNDTVE